MRSGRGFGLLGSVVLGAYALAPLLRSEMPRSWALAASLIFLFLALLRPLWLLPLRAAWLWFGARIESVSQPVIMAVLFYGVFCPMGWVMKRLRRGPMALGFDKQAESYWLECAQKEPYSVTMRYPF
jgi:uncharacterized membrane protein